MRDLLAPLTLCGVLAAFILADFIYVVTKKAGANPNPRRTIKRPPLDPAGPSGTRIGGEFVANMGELRDLVKPYVREGRTINDSAASEPDGSQFLSHYGGRPYFEKGDKWPKNSNGENMYFVMQIFNDGSLPWPKGIKLLQFFYDTGRNGLGFERESWDKDGRPVWRGATPREVWEQVTKGGEFTKRTPPTGHWDDYYIRVWHELDKAKNVVIEPPQDLVQTHLYAADYMGRALDTTQATPLNEIMPYREITFGGAVKSFPDHSTLANLLDGERGFDDVDTNLDDEDYDDLVLDLAGHKSPLRAALGGWANTFQGDEYLYLAGDKKYGDIQHNAKTFKKMKKIAHLLTFQWWEYPDCKRYADGRHADGFGYIMYDTETKKTTYIESGT